MAAPRATGSGGRSGRPRWSSGLTVRGRCLLAGGIATGVSAVVLDERDLLRLALFVVALPLLSLLVAAVTRRVVRADRTVDPARVSVGAECTVDVRLSGGPLVGALRVADTVPDAAGPRPSAPPRFTVHRLPPRTGVLLRYPLRPVLRGDHRVGPLVARVTDPLGLAEFPRRYGGADRLLVLPATVDLHGLPSALGGGEGTPGAVVAHQGIGEPDVMVRPYRSGDEIRRVHWRATARHDELMVRLEERPWRGEITVLLDRRDGAHRGDGPSSSLEYAVSMAASIALHLVRAGEPVTVVTEDGAALAPRLGGSSGLPATGADELLDALATLRVSARTTLDGPLLAPSGDVVAIVGETTSDDVAALLERRPASGHAVVLDVASWDDGATARPADATAADLRRAGWHVTVARADTDPRTSWADLSSGRRLVPGAAR
ncbi:DUF58 domain-containing protein [Pseudonocardia benzenivorans]|uniref:DUF58 domain-containing protein n=1 Tax=Pseudonocardia benzenivorans TaxID=228005 RepID=A0ABW3VSB8_9PSEU